MSVNVVWFKRDLRVRDHLPLALASARGTCLCLYVYEPELLESPEFDASHLVFINQALSALDRSLQALGGRLTTRVGRMPQVLDDLHCSVQIKALWSHQETGNAITYARDRRVSRWARSHSIPWRQHPQDGVVRMLPSRDAWANLWSAAMHRPEAPPPRQIQSPTAIDHGAILAPTDLGLPPNQKTEAQRGGEPSAHAILHSFLDHRGVLIIEGGGSVSDDAQRIVMGAIIIQTLRYIRSRPKPEPPVILVLDEATNANLIGASGYEVRAVAETQKMGLALHTLVQSLNFPSTEITDGMLTNCLRHEWFFAANEAIVRKAASDLGSKEYEAGIRSLKPGQRYVKDRDRVFREYVPLLEDPWGFPGLARKKAQRALEEIKKRPEYRTPHLLPGQFVEQEDDRSKRQTGIDDDRQRTINPPSPSPEPNNPNLGI